MDKFYRERIKIIGGPGCGKTTKLLEILKHQFRNGLKHDQVAMVAFARATVFHLRERCKDEFVLLEQDADALIAMTKKEWPTIKYREALALIKEKDGIDVPFGKDLRTEEEKAIMQHYDTPVVVTHYPVEAMGFYKPRDPQVPDEALCFDILAPPLKEKYQLSFT